MIVLATDHFSVLMDTQHSKHHTLKNRLEDSLDQDIAVSIVAEEQLRGWLAVLSKHADVEKQLTGYQRLLAILTLLRNWTILPFERRAISEFQRLRKARIRIGSQELKIASIVLVNQAVLHSANFRDFRRVPALRVESWIG